MTDGRPRRRSIFGGLLWIVAGSLLLANNLHPELGVWRLFSRYWPVLLILLGLAKLFDHFAARRTGQAPARLITGGEVFLILALLLVAGGISLIRKFPRDGPDVIGLNLPWEKEYSYTEEVAKAVKPGAQISIADVRGSVTVHPEEAAEIRIEVNKKVRSGGEREAQERARQTSVVIAETAGGYEVRTETAGHTPGSVRVDLDVHVPRQAGINAKTERGDIHVSGVAGPVNVSTQNGDVEIHEVAGDVDADVHHGDVRVTQAEGNVKLNGRGGEVEVSDVAGQAWVRGEFGGPIRFKNVGKETNFISRRTELVIGKLPGHADLESGNLAIYDAQSSVALTTHDYDIVMENVDGRVRVENRHGNIELRYSKPPREDVEITNEKGGVELVLPGSASFEISASSRAGDVETDFQGPELKTTEDHNTSKLEGKVGTRGPQLRLKTTYGTVRIRKGS